MGDVYNISQTGQGHQVVIQKGEELKARLGNIQLEEGQAGLDADIADLVDQVMRSDDLSANQKKQILEALESTEAELERAPARRDKSRIRQALDTAYDVAKAAVPIAAAIAKIASLF
ncbi:MAG: hypothetical protein E6J43_11915 [Chloroflexi bacterium]|nr:MAG: hypothetical protein E6J43_11915 [Chloroflexota bacterium]